MIRIDRPNDVPSVLLKAGTSQRKKYCTLYDANAKEYSKGSQSFEFKRSIYAHQSVKEQLHNAQFKKCCYCETVVFSISGGAIEHFRPKTAVRQGRGQPRIRPGYYWLAYQWENLLFICGTCNTKKSDLFPLSNPSSRARSHHDDITAEDPLLVDPSSNDPRLDIRFQRDVPVGVTTRGSKTIKLLRLDELGLSEDRRERLDILRRLVDTIRIFSNDAMSEKAKKLVADIKDELADAIKPSSQFSSMAIDFLQTI